MDKLQKEFEAWYNTHYVKPIIAADRVEGGYQITDQQEAWDIWQAVHERYAPKSDQMAFALQHDETGEIQVVTISRDEIINSMGELILDKVDCGCEPVGETNVVECNCQEWSEGFQIIEPPKESSDV